MTEKQVRWFDRPELKKLEAALAKKRASIAESRSREEEVESRLAQAREVLTDSRALSSIGKTPSPTVTAAEDAVSELEGILSRLRGEQLALEAELPADVRALEHLRAEIARETCASIQDEVEALCTEQETLFARAVAINTRLDELRILAMTSFESEGAHAEVTRAAGIPRAAGFDEFVRLGAYAATPSGFAEWRERWRSAVASARRQFETRQRGLAGKVA